jgi:hypothetical protein
MNKSTGFLTVEFMVALAVFTGVVAVAARAVFEVQDIVAAISGYSNALELAEQDARFVASSTGPLQNMPLSGEVPTPFSVSRELVPLTPCSERLREQVTWQGFRAHMVLLNTTVHDLQSPADLGEDCAALGLSYAWNTTSIVGSQSLHARVQFHGVDVVTRNSKRIAIVVGSSTQSADPDIYAVDITTPGASQVLGQLHMGPGLFAVDVAGSFAYAVQNSASFQLQIIDIADPAHMSVAASLSLPTVTGSFPEGRSIYVFRNRAYVGTYETAGAEFHVFDITNPRSPVWLGSRALNHSIRNIIVRTANINGNERLLAYLASSGNSVEVVIVDVTSPAAMSELSHIDLPGVGSSSALVAADTRLLVGRQQGSGESAVWGVNIANPTAPVLMAGSNIGLKSGSIINGLSVSNGQAVLTTTDTTAPFVLCAIDTVFTLTNCKKQKLFTDPGRLDMQDNMLFVAAGHALTILTGQ